MTNKPQESLPRRERERLARRQDILKAATKVFGEKGFHTATLDEIAQEAEFAKGTLYLYFESKEDILASIIAAAMEEWKESAFSALSGERPLRVELTEMFKLSAHARFERDDLFRLMSLQLATLFETLSEEKCREFTEFHNHIWNDIVKPRIEKAVADGEVRDLPVNAIIGLIHGALDSMIMTKWNADTIEYLVGAVDSFMEIVFNGIAPKQGETA
jgi:TetR/AcrR family transcriptional regulator, repressor of fatR-cypB operon